MESFQIFLRQARRWTDGSVIGSAELNAGEISRDPGCGVGDHSCVVREVGPLSRRCDHVFDHGLVSGHPEPDGEPVQIFATDPVAFPPLEVAASAVIDNASQPVVNPKSGYGVVDNPGIS